MNKTPQADPPCQHAHQALAPPMDPPDSIEYDKDPKWDLDSGASMHISFDIRSFHTLDLNPYDPLPTVTFGNNHHLQATGIGSIKFLLPGSSHSPPSTMILDDVLYILQAAANLFLVKQVYGRGEAVIFAEDQCLYYKDQVLLFKSPTNSHTNYLSAATAPGPFTLKDVPTIATYV
jgi:hypothetical protein